MSGESSEQDLYDILGASPSDSLQQLKHKYQQMALLYHPDRLSGVSSSEAEAGLRRFLAADAAWKVLSDHNARTKYDLLRRAKDLKQDWPVDSAIYLEDMAWDEEDAVYSYTCRCGGEFIVTEDELVERQRPGGEDEEERAKREGEEDDRDGQRLHETEPEEEEGVSKRRDEDEEERDGGIVVCCDTCSLSIYVSRGHGDTKRSHLLKTSFNPF